MSRMILTAAFFAIVFSSCSHEQPSLTKEEVMAAIAKFDNAWEHKDMKTVDSMLAKDYTYFTKSGGIFNRDGVVATAGEPDYSLRDMSRSEFEIIIHDNTAVVSTRWKGKGAYRGDPFDEDQRCSIVVVKRKDKVEILTEHCTPIETKKVFH
jgi:hypothetical protein